MNIIAQEIKYRLSILKFAAKNGVSAAAREYKVSRMFVYRLKRRYDGTAESLALKSRRPHAHPNQHTAEELELIRNMRRRNPHDLSRRILVQAGAARATNAPFRALLLHAAHEARESRA